MNLSYKFVSAAYWRFICSETLLLKGWERGNSAILARAERGPLVRRAEEKAWSRASELLLLDAIQCAKANLDPTSVP